MAVHRTTPTCPDCGQPIAKGIYRNDKDLPSMLRIIGDNFVRWEYIPHHCLKRTLQKIVRPQLKKRKTINDLAKAVNEFLDKIEKKTDGNKTGS